MTRKGVGISILILGFLRFFCPSIHGAKEGGGQGDFWPRGHSFLIILRSGDFLRFWHYFLEISDTFLVATPHYSDVRSKVWCSSLFTKNHPNHLSHYRYYLNWRLKPQILNLSQMNWWHALLIMITTGAQTHKSVPAYVKFSDFRLFDNFGWTPTHQKIPPHNSECGYQFCHTSKIAHSHLLYTQISPICSI